MKHIVLGALVVLSGLSVQAAMTSESQWVLTGSALSVPMDKLTTSDSGKKDTFGEFYTPLGFRYRTKMFDYDVAPGFATTLLLPKKSSDGAVTKDFFILDLPFYFPKSELFSWKLGPGLYVYQQKGSGGSTVLNNGTGTATFQLPGRTQQSKIVAIDAGASWAVGGSGRFELDLISFGLLSNEKRTFLLAMTFGVAL